MGRPILTAQDYERIAKKDLNLTLKHLQDYENKYPNEFKEFSKESSFIRSLKKLEIYQS